MTDGFDVDVFHARCAEGVLSIRPRGHVRVGGDLHHLLRWVADKPRQGAECLPAVRTDGGKGGLFELGDERADLSSFERDSAFFVDHG